jgi:hypothetical protein
MDAANACRPTGLIVTVGSNPLPIAVAALHLKPAKVHYLHTPQTAPIVERLARLLGSKDHGEGEKVLVTEPYSARRIAERLDHHAAALKDACLHYSGGAKPLVVHTHRWWRGKQQPGTTASYLGADACLYFDGGHPEPQRLDREPRLTLDEICDLHFDEHPHCEDEHRQQRPAALAARVQPTVAESGWDAYRKLLPAIYGSRHECAGKTVHVEYRAADRRNFDDESCFATRDLSPLLRRLEVDGARLDDVCSHLGKPMGNQRQIQASRCETAKWLWGKWLEVWLAGALAVAKDETERPLFDEVRQGVKVGQQPYDFEMDVVAVRGHRVFLFSCTTDVTKALVKEKLFEARHRSARIGGELARAAVVSFHPCPHEVLATVRERHWEGYGTFRLFGIEHVRGGEAPCDIDENRNPEPSVTLLEGVREWVAS